MKLIKVVSLLDYLSRLNNAPLLMQKVHGMLADYFSGTSSEKRDPESDDKSDSLEALYAVNTQPLLLNEGLGLYNIRRLSELPHVLARSGRFAYQALTELLLDYQWLKACVLSLSSWDLIHDFTSVVPTVPIGRSAISMAFSSLHSPYLSIHNEILWW
jgi:hypothetical protein